MMDNIRKYIIISKSFQKADLWDAKNWRQIWHKKLFFLKFLRWDDLSVILKTIFLDFFRNFGQFSQGRLVTGKILLILESMS